MTQPKTTRHIKKQAAVVAAQLISESGGITQAERDKLAFITVTLAINLDTLESNVTTDLSIGVVDASSVEIESSDGTNAVIPLATGTLAGLMSAADKAKLDLL
jgi:hypothetical protein